MNKRSTATRVLGGILAIMAFAPSLATAAGSTWNQTTAGSYNWSDTGNWSPSTPNAIGATGSFTGAFTGAETISLNGAVTTGTLGFNQSGGAVTIAAGTSGTLTMQVASGSAAINVTDTESNRTNIISAPVAFASNTNINFGTGGVLGYSLALSGGISGSGNVTLTGGTFNTEFKNVNLEVAGNPVSTYSGNWTFSGTEGQLGSLTGSGGVGIKINSDSDLGAVPSTPTTNITVTANALGAIYFDSNITLNANRNISVASGGILALEGSTSATIAGVISGQGGILLPVNAQGIVLTLKGANTYTGTTSVFANSLAAGAINTFSSGSEILVGTSNQATVQLAGFNQTIGSLAGGSFISGQLGQVVLGGATLTTGNDNTSTTYAGAITGSGSAGGTGNLVKIGTGTQTLSSLSSYTGTTTVANGGLKVTGTFTSGVKVVVGNGTAAAATLSGTGIINGTVTTAATVGSDVAHLAPGSNTSGNFGSAGTLTTGNLVLGSGTNLDFDLSNSATNFAGNDFISNAGTLTIGSALTFNFNETGTSLDTANKYQLISFSGTAPTLTGVTFTTTGDTGYTAAYSIDGGGAAIDVAFTALSVTPTAAFFNGKGTDLSSFANFDTTVSSGTAVSAALAATTNVSFNANQNTTVSTATLNSALDINSVTFGTGTGTHSGMTINGTGTLTVEATTANSNGLGNGITVNTGGGNNAINTAIALGNDQTWTITDSTSTLTAGGPVSGAHMLSTAGSGVLALTNASGNSYSGGTSVGGTSKLFIQNTSGSATGTGSLTVARGASLAGSGIVNATSGAIGIGTTGSNGLSNVYVGQAVGGDTGTTANLTLKAASGLSIANTTLTFNLNVTSVGGSGAPSLANGGTGASGSGNELIVGSTGVTFGTGVTLQLNMQGTGVIANNTAYVLFAGTGTGSGLNNSLYSGLTNGGTDSQGHIIVQGLTLSFGGSTPPSWYANSYIFLNQDGGVDDLEIEVVPEPSTWAMIIAGFGILLGVQRLRRRKTV